MDDFCTFHLQDGVCYGLNESCLWRRSVCSSAQVHPGSGPAELWASACSFRHVPAVNHPALLQRLHPLPPLCAPSISSASQNLRFLADLLNGVDIIRHTTTPWRGSVFTPQLEITASRLISIASPRRLCVTPWVGWMIRARLSFQALHMITHFHKDDESVAVSQTHLTCADLLPECLWEIISSVITEAFTLWMKVKELRMGFFGETP